MQTCKAVAFLFFVSTATAQALPGGDTSAFKANIEEGWIKISSYATRDSSGNISFELIMQRGQQVNNWKIEQYIGYIIGDHYLSGTELKLDYFLLKNSRWQVRITPEGKMWLSLVEGYSPSEVPLMLPIKVHYNVIPYSQNKDERLKEK